MIISFLLKHILLMDVEHFSQRTEADFNKATKAMKVWNFSTKLF